MRSWKVNLKNIIIFSTLLVSLTLAFLATQFQNTTPSNRQLSSIQALKDNQNITAIIGNNEFYLEVARSESARATGLMFRETLKEKSGMLFVFDKARFLSFYMKNTLIPLDIIFINNKLEITDIQKNTKPLDDKILYKSSEPAILVIELAANSADTYDIKEGDRVEFLFE